MSCPVCLNEITSPKVTSCKHAFCAECLDAWLQREETCPMCRKNLNGVEEAVQVRNLCLRLPFRVRETSSTKAHW